MPKFEKPEGQLAPDIERIYNPTEEDRAEIQKRMEAMKALESKINSFREWQLGEGGIPPQPNLDEIISALQSDLENFSEGSFRRIFPGFKPDMTQAQKEEFLDKAVQMYYDDNNGFTSYDPKNQSEQDL